MLRGLFRVAWYELRSAIWPHSPQRRFYRIGAIGLGVALWIGIFRAVSAGVDTLTMRFPGIEAVIPRTVDLLLFVLFFALVYSSVLVTLARVFLAESLRLVGVLPAAPGQFFFSYWLQVVVAAGWMPLAFGSAILSGLGAGLGVSSEFYVALAVGLPLFVTASVTVAIIATTAVSTVLPATRARDMLVVLSLIGLVSLFIVVRSARPERIIGRSGVRELTESLVRFEVPGAGYLPSSLLSNVLTPVLTDGAPNLGAAGLLALSALVLAALGYLVFAIAFPRARSRALSARGQWLTEEGPMARAINWVTRFLPRSVAAVTRKDLLHLGRDATQWSQLLLIVGLAVIYLFNMSALPVGDLRAIGVSRAQAADAIAVLNLLPAGFVLSAVALRFVYAAISLEGRAIWIALSAPTGLGTLIAAKIAVGLPLLVILGAALVVGTNELVGASATMSALSMVAVLFMAIALSGLAAGLGIMRPNFRADHPTEVVTSVGGFVFMALAVVFSVVLVLVSAPGAWYVHQRLFGSELPPAATAVAVLSFGVAVLVSLATAVVPVVFGLARADSQRLEP